MVRNGTVVFHRNANTEFIFDQNGRNFLPSCLIKIMSDKSPPKTMNLFVKNLKLYIFSLFESTENIFTSNFFSQKILMALKYIGLFSAIV